MGRFLSISWLAAALACGSVEDKQACSTSTQCPVGQYCAHAEGESRCWADATAPVVQSVTASCTPTPCLRDGVLRVEATVTDDAEVLDAAVSLDLGGTPVPMTRSGPKWVADVQLRTFPFRAFARDVVASVVARDGARNPSVAKGAGAVGVTRLRWERTVDATPGFSMTAPAVRADGTAVLGGSNGKLYFVPVDSALPISSLAVAASQITAAPAIGDRAIWVGSDDFSLRAVALDGSAVTTGVGVNVSGPIRGSIAVLPGTGKEWGVACSGTGFVGVASTSPGDDDLVGPTSSIAAGPIVAANGRIFAATSVSSATLRAYDLNASAVVLSEAWSVGVDRNVSAPLAIDDTGAIWTGSFDGKLNKTVPGESSGAVTLIATVPGAIVDAPVVLANGDVVVGDDSGVLHRFTRSGSQVWATEPNLGTAVGAALVLAGGDATFVVPTAAGSIFARSADGTHVWSAALDTGNALRAPNIHTPPNQTSNVMSTAYVASSSGKLFAVIVDGQLDSAAPWPKAFHDPRNTNRAGPQP